MSCLKCGGLWSQGVNTEELRAELKKRDDLEKKIREEFFKKEWPDKKFIENFVFLYPTLLLVLLFVTTKFRYKEYEAWISALSIDQAMLLMIAFILSLIGWLFLSAVLLHLKRKSVWKKYEIAYPEYARMSQ